MKQSRAKGFTLTEVVLAIGVVAVLIVDRFTSSKKADE